MINKDKKSDHLKYGEGQREQYGEGEDYRPEDKTEAVDDKDKGGFAGGGRPSEKGTSSREAPEKSRQ
jgi:hypothetical protein